jgi:hypothetical protein
VAVTSTSVVNEAIMLMGGNQPLVTGVAPNFDTSASGKAAALLYAPTVAAITRQGVWDFARAEVALVNTTYTPPFMFQYEYAYPANCNQVLQVLGPSTPVVNNPVPVNWSVGTSLFEGGSPVKVIWTNLSAAWCFYSSSAPLENLWDPLFHQAVVRLLSSSMAMALAGKPDVAMNLIEQAGKFTELGETRDS